MARNFQELRNKLSPERRARNSDEAKRALLEMTLQELRQKVADLSQDDVAEALEVTQGYVSKLERQDDMTVSKLYAFVEALGGVVEIRARFPEREVQIRQFEEMVKQRSAVAAKSAHKKVR